MTYARLGALKTYLGIAATTTADDDLLENLLKRTTARIDQYCRRRFSALTATRYYEADRVSGDILYLDDDLLTVTTLTNGDDDVTVIPSTEYWLIDRNQGPPYYGIRLKSDSTYSWEVDQDCFISVTGTWGWSADPPDDIVQACIEWAGYLYRQKDSTGDVVVVPEAGMLTVPEGMPKTAKMALEPYVKLV